LPLVSKRQRLQLQLNQLQYNKLLQRQSKLKKIMADAATILARKVPILCYHNIKDFADQAGEMTKTYTVKPLSFAAQMKAIHDAGYHSILPIIQLPGIRRSFTLKTYYDYL
jgi:hypothetical protein